MAELTFGSYRCIEQLGAGGMGIVYLAQHPLLGKRVAVKVLRPELTGNREFVDRFLNEARATTLIQHPGLVQIFDLGHAEGGGIYIVMELLAGETLATRLKREKTLPIGVALDIARQVAQALGAVHERGIVHRDLKPDNIFLLPDARLPGGVRVKVIDFGIAKLLDAPGKLTRTGTLMGTPVYMSPEQCRGDSQVNHRTDVYALGCILFEMICGRPPYPGQAPGVLLSAHLFDPIPELPPVVPATLAASIRRTMAKGADERQQSMAQLAAELESPEAVAARRAEAPTVMAMAAVSEEVAATIVQAPPPEAVAGETRAAAGETRASAARAVAGEGASVPAGGGASRAARIAIVALVATAIGVALLFALR